MPPPDFTRRRSALRKPQSPALAGGLTSPFPILQLPDLRGLDSRHQGIVVSIVWSKIHCFTTTTYIHYLYISPHLCPPIRHRSTSLPLPSSSDRSRSHTPAALGEPPVCYSPFPARLQNRLRVRIAGRVPCSAFLLPTPPPGCVAYNVSPRASQRSRLASLMHVAAVD